MTVEHLLPVPLQVFAAVVLIAFLGWIAYLVRYHRLSLRESLLWLVSTGVALVFTIFPSTLVWAAGTLRVNVPSNALFAFAFVYVLLNLVSLTVAQSNGSTRLRRLTQECAILRAEMELLRAEVRGRVASSEP